MTALGPVRPSEAKPLIADVSGGMDALSEHLEDVLPTFSESISLMAGDIRSFINVSYDFVTGSYGGPEQLQDFKDMLEQMTIAMENSVNSYGDMRFTVASLHRMTSVFNKSRRRLISNVTRIIEAIENGKSLLNQALSELDELIRYAKRGNV